MQENSPTSSDGLQITAATTVAGRNTTETRTSSDITTATSQEEHYFSHNPFLSPTSPGHLDSIEAYFYSSSLLSENSTPPDTFFDDAIADNFGTERRLRQASFVLEYQQLYNRYNVCLAHLQESIKEVDSFRQENDALRIANADLAKRLSLLTQATIQNCLRSDFNRLNLGNDSPPPQIIPNPKSLNDSGRIQRPPPTERVTLPKSISVRSTGYLKMKPQSGINTGDQTQSSTRPQVNSSCYPGSVSQFNIISLQNFCFIFPFSVWQLSGALIVISVFQQRVYVPGGKTEEMAAEFEVYNQGMVKTELCNKWQENGTCPYGENCQFAHGIKELRPVLRHPRYKTEVCRMVLAGDICPYGHRCHFRHTLTDQEKLVALRYSQASET